MLNENTSFSILVVDDELYIAKVLTSVLKERGYLVDFALSGEEALELTATTKFDLILLDLRMPGMDGFEVCTCLKDSSVTKDIPVVFLTAITEVNDVVKAFELGAVDYITKPFNQIELSARVETHLRHKRTLEKYKIARIEAEDANRAKSEFLANMSHDIRTPLNAVTGFSELLASIIMDPKQQSYIEAVITASKSLHTLISDLLDLAKIEAGRVQIKYSPVNLTRLFLEIEQIFERKIKVKNLQFMIEMDDKLPGTLMLDETRLRQVLLNLVGNAVKFTEKGYIKISVMQIKKSETQNQLGLAISIEDSGIGIPKNEREKLFTALNRPSAQSFSNFGGVGLGLTISKRLLEMMNGDIILKNTQGPGSNFEISLHNIDISSIELPLVEEVDFNIQDIHFDRGKVLIVDDIESNRFLLCELMDRVNLDYITAENGQEALLIAEEYLPDIILMDMQMPVMNGFEATKRLKGNPKTRKIPVIALSASTPADDFLNTPKINFDGYLIKPLDINRLFAKLFMFLDYSGDKQLESSYFQFDKEDFSFLSLSQFYELIEKLESQFLVKWSEFQEKQPVNEVKQFGHDLKNLAVEYKMDFLQEFAGKLITYVETFDVDNILYTLHEFPELIQKLKSIADEKDQATER